MESKSTVSWNAFDDSVSTIFRNLMLDTDFTDVTLVFEDDKQIDAHKVVLSSASTFFKRVFVRNPHPKPMLYLKGLRYEDVKSVLEFIYFGQTEICQEKISRFIGIALDLEITGIDENILDSEKHDLSTEVNPNQETESLYPHTEIVVDDDPFVEEPLQSVDDKMIPEKSSELVTDSTQSMDDDAKLKNDDCIEGNIPEYKHSLQALKLAYKKGGSFPCSLCDKSFTHLSVLQRHNKIIHDGIRYPCTMCDYKGTQQFSLKRHVQSKHSF